MILLNQIQAQIHELPLLLVGTYRDDETPALPETLPGMQVMKLARLSDDAITELSTSMLGQAGSQPAVINLLRRETEGNAFFMVEVVRSLAESAGRLTDVGRTMLPDTVIAGGVRQVIRRRLERIPDGLQPLLKLTAAIGRQPDPLILKRLIPDSQRLDHFLTVCANAAVLEPVGGGDQRWRFSHDKIREFILNEFKDDERARLHRQVAETIEALYPDHEAYAGVLTEHWRHARDSVKETHYARIAAARLFRIGSLPGARILLERALTLNGSENEHGAILKVLGDIYERMGDYPLAVDAYQRSLKLATTPEETGRVLIGLSWVTWEQGNEAGAREYAIQGLTLCQQANDQRGISRIFGILGILAAESSDFATAETYFSQGLAMQQQIDDKRGISVSYQNLGQLASMRGDTTAAQDYLERSMRLQREMGDLRGLVGSLQNLADLYLEQGHFDQVRSLLREQLTIVREMGVVPYQLHGVMMAAQLYLRTGEPEQAAIWTTMVAAHPACNEELRNAIGVVEKELTASSEGVIILADAQIQAQTEPMDLTLVLEMIEMSL
jgi:tetratricopeptide (TPR) repeat protein